MSSKQILFNTEMVKAVLDGRKMQTRRVFSKTQLKYFYYAQKLGEMSSLDNLHENDFAFILQFSQYKVGDILYVREKSYFVDCDCQSPWQCSPQGWYATDEVSYSGIRCSVETIPSIHMRKEYARIFLKVTNVRVERLQDISDEDCIKEGIVEVTKDNQVFKFCIYDKKDYSSTPWQDMPRNPQEVYKKLWNSTSKDGYKWEDNPYVFVYDFERVEKQ